MLLDNNLLVSNAQTVTGTNTSVLSTNTVDLGTNRDIGAGTEYPTLQAVIGTAFAGATSVEIQAIQADDAALSSGVTVIGSSGPIPLASLVAAARFEVNLNTRIGSKGQRYLGARYVIVGAGSAGAVTSFFGLDTQDGQKFYPSGYTVA
jgi:hypothetical protein